MDGITPVAAEVQPPDINRGLGTLNSILGLRQRNLALQQAQQNLQTGQYVQQQEQGTAQQSQEEMAERQKLQQQVQSGAFGDPNSDDYASKMADWSRGNLPLIGNDVAQKAIKTQSDKTNLRAEVADLSQKYRAGMGGIVSSFIGKPTTSDQIDDAIDAYVGQNPAAKGAAYHAKDLIDHLDKVNDQATRDQALSHLAAEFQGVSQMEAGSIDKGGQVQPIGVNRYGLPPTPQGAPIQKTLSPQVIAPPGGIPQVAGGAAGNGIKPSYPGPQPTDQDMQAFGDYQKNLNTRVVAGSKSLPMLRVAQNALDEIQGGAGTETRSKWAYKLDALGAPKSLVNAIASGNLAQVQVAEKTLFQSALGTLISSGGASTNDQVQRALTLLPNVGTDPAASHEMLQLLADQQQTDYAEQQALVKTRKEGTFNPVTWAGDWQERIRGGKEKGIPATQVPPTGSLSSGQHREGETGKSKSGKPIVWRGGRWEYP